MLYTSLAIAVFFTNIEQQKPSKASIFKYETEHKNQVSLILASASESILRKPRLRADNDNATLEIYKIAILRSPDAIPFLILHIAYEPNENELVVQRLPTLKSNLPCVYALAEIGLPAFPAVLKLAESEYREIYHMYCAYVFRRSLGKDQAIAFLTCHLGID